MRISEEFKEKFQSGSHPETVAAMDAKDAAARLARFEVYNEAIQKLMFRALDELGEGINEKDHEDLVRELNYASAAFSNAWWHVTSKWEDQKGA